MIYLFGDFVKKFWQKSKRREGVDIVKKNPFIAEVKSKMYLRGWKAKDLAKAANCKVSYIYAFMGGHRDSQEVKKAIAEALNIKIWFG